MPPAIPGTGIEVAIGSSRDVQTRSIHILTRGVIAVKGHSTAREKLIVAIY